MTYRYVELALGRKPQFMADVIVPLSPTGEEIKIVTPADDELLWVKRVIDYWIKDKVLYCRLEV